MIFSDCPALSVCVLIFLSLLVQSIFVGANFSVPVQVRACVWWVLIPEGGVWACCPAAGGGPHLRQEWWVICGVSEVGNLKPLLYCMALLTGTVSLSGCDWTVGQKPKTLATLCGVAYIDFPCVDVIGQWIRNLKPLLHCVVLLT